MEHDWPEEVWEWYLDRFTRCLGLANIVALKGSNDPFYYAVDLNLWRPRGKKEIPIGKLLTVIGDPNDAWIARSLWRRWL
jgi:hypothetical protein